MGMERQRVFKIARSPENNNDLDFCSYPFSFENKGKDIIKFTRTKTF